MRFVEAEHKPGNPCTVGVAAVLWQYKRIALIKTLWRQEILLPEHNPNKGCSTAPHSTQRCSGWCQIGEVSPGPWSAVVIKSLGTEVSAGTVHPVEWVIFPPHSLQKKSQSLCIQTHFGTMPQDPKAPFSMGILLPWFSGGKNTNFLKIPYSKGIGILSSLGISLPLFVTTSGKHPLSISIMCVFF